MAEEPPSRPTPPRIRSNPGPPQGNTPPGWKVTPTPDGRGARPGQRSPMGPNPRWLIALLIVVLLGLNFWLSSQALKPNSRVRIPFNPTFLSQVDSGNVKEVTSTNNAIQGTFKNEVKYPPDDKNVQATTRFSTQVPSF